MHPSSRSSTGTRPSTVPDPLLDALNRLIAVAHATGLDGTRTTAPAIVPAGAESAAQTALVRLIHGAGLPNDDSMLPIPVAGARLVAVAFEPPAAAAVWPALTLSAGSALAVQVDPEHLAVLVRNSPRRAGEDRGLKIALQLAAQARRAVPTATCGVSGALQNAAQLQAAWSDCCFAAGLAGRDNLDVVRVDDAWATITLERLRQHLAACLPVGNAIAQLREHDHRTGSTFLETATDWLWCNQDTNRSAERLNVHPNTLRYRLRRTRDIAGLDLTDPEHRLVAQLLGVSEQSARE